MKTDVYSAMLATTLLFMSGVLVPVNALLESIPQVPSPPDIEVSPPDASNIDVPSTDSLPELPAACLIKTLIGSSNLLLKLGLLVCMYDQGLEAVNDDNFEAVFKGLRDTLVGTGCIADGLLGTGDTVQTVGGTSATVAEAIVNQLRPILDKSGLTPTLMKTACDLLAPALSPDCLPALLAQDVVKLIIDMKTQVCQGQNEHLFYEDIAAALKRLGCVLKSPGELAALPGVPDPSVPDAEIPDLDGEPNDVVIKVACIAVETLLSGISPV